MHSLRDLDPFFTEIRGRVKFIQGQEILTQQTGHADVSYEVQNRDILLSTYFTKMLEVENLCK